MCSRWHGEEPPWRGGPPWMAGRTNKRRFMFMRFALFFGTILGLFLTALIVVLALLFQPLHTVLPRPQVLLLVLCGVPLSFTALAAVFGGLAFRRIGSPVADVMAAADAVAEGNLSVRVREDIPGEFGRLAQSFNRMTSELERSEHQRRNLTADVAHELRTPLHIIQGNLEGILDGVYEPTPEQITATLEETRLLARLVNDLQTLSLAEAGQLPLHRVPLSAVDLLSDVATSFAGQAADAGVDLRVDVTGDESALALEADPDRLEQMISNLVMNALRYTPAGGQVTLRAAPLEDGVRLVVADTGAGISPEDLPYIFDRFWRGDRSRTRQGGTGSGLGLAIARQLVQAHSGTIRADSQPGKGTTFTIDLPRTEQKRQES